MKKVLQIWGWISAILAVLVILALAVYGVFWGVRSLGAAPSPEPAVPAIAEDVVTSTPTVEKEEAREIQLEAGDVERVAAGLNVVGDVEVSTSSDGPWTALHDDKAETGLIVVFDEAGFVRAPWGGTITNQAVSGLEAAMRSGGCVGGCEEVVVVSYPSDVAGAAELVGPTPEVFHEPGKWVLADPPGPEDLPDLLHEAIGYRQPPVDCAVKNEPQRSCSTLEGQLTSGNFVLAPGEAILMTGDAITIVERGSNQALAPRPTGNGVHDLWLLVNLSDTDWELRMHAPHGSFRGYYYTADSWTTELVAYLRDLHLNLFNLPVQTFERFQPTPVPNCGSPDGCDFVDVRLGIRFAADLVQWFNGHWGEHTSPNWVPAKN